MLFMEGKPPKLGSGRRSKAISEIEEKEARAFVLAVLAVCEEGKKPTSANLKSYYSTQASSWKRPSEKIISLAKVTGFNPFLLGIATWDVVKSILLIKPHGNRSGMKDGRRHLVLSGPELEERKQPYVLTDEAYNRLSKEGKDLVGFARGVAPERESSTRKQSPPKNILNLSKRMVHHWRKHRDYPEAKKFIKREIERIHNDYYKGIIPDGLPTPCIVPTEKREVDDATYTELLSLSSEQLNEERDNAISSGDRSMISAIDQISANQDAPSKPHPSPNGSLLKL